MKSNKGKVKKGEKERRKRFIHQRMWKPDFGTVHGAISGGFEDGKKICIFWIEEERIDRILLFLIRNESSTAKKVELSMVLRFYGLR